MMEEDNCGVGNSLRVTAKSTDDNRKRINTSLVHPFSVDVENTRESRHPKNDFGNTTNFSDGLTAQINLPLESYTDGNISAYDVVGEDKNKRVRRYSNNKTQANIAKEQEVNKNSSKVDHSMYTPVRSQQDGSQKCVYQNIDQLESPETIIPNLTEGITGQNLNAPCSMSGILSIDNKIPLNTISNTEEQLRCMICYKSIMSINIATHNKNFICSQKCLEKFKEKHSGNIVVGPLRANNSGINETPQNNLRHYNANVDNARTLENIKCKNCIMPIQNLSNSFSWETLDFCNEKCLRDYQKSISPLCSNCRTLVQDENLLGRYRVRFGYSIKQFCTSMCLENYKETLKICIFCQGDISSYRNIFLVSANDKGTRKDFCSVQCIENYNKMNQLKDLNTPEECCVCRERATIEIEFKFKNQINLICSQSCLLAFKIVNYITSEKCDFCYKYYAISSIGNGHLIRYDGIFKRFCQETCRNNYITSNRKVHSCHWCKVKKFNFDMIQKYNEDNTVLIACSLPCLRSSITSTSSNVIKWIVCDVCRKVNKGKFCIVPTEGTVRYFCSFQCVRKYLQASGAQLLQTNAQASRHVVPDVPGPLPVITSVKSLAPNKNHSKNGKDLYASKKKKMLSDLSHDELSSPTPGKIVVLKSTNLPLLRNVSTSTRPTTFDVGINFKPVTSEKATLTEKLRSLNLIPVPVPIYVPTPIPMFTLMHVKPILFPLPIPIPVLIPLTIHASNNIFNKTKHQSSNTSDLCDINSLAGTLSANEKKNSEIVDLNKNQSNKKALVKPKLEDSIIMCNDDIKDMGVQCDFVAPPIDFEENIVVNTITATYVTKTQFVEFTVEKYIFPGKKCQIKQSSLFKNNEKFETKTQLKCIYGVNAWKSWVKAKNEELQKSFAKTPTFKSELTELSAEELNNSLALFIQEVRKPNGEEYTPDTIFYFCLGIQHYLYEHARGDNIFYDGGYENFIASLDMICNKFAICIDSKYIVTRIEEEHLWESKQIGAHSPYALLLTIIYLATKYFNLMTVDDHMLLSFSNVVKCTESLPNKQEAIDNRATGREFLRYQPTVNNSKNKTHIYQVNTHEDGPLKCFVKLYDFYLSKCPKRSKTRSDVLYLLPKKSCTSNNIYWYTTTPVGHDMLSQMVQRIKMVKEINVALLAL